MKTDDLVQMLATNVEPMGSAGPRKRLSVSLALGAAGSMALLLLTMGIAPVLFALASTPMFWVKIAFIAGCVVGAAVLTLRLGTPGAALGRAPVMIALPIIAIWALAGISLLEATSSARIALLLGTTWRECSWSIALLSVPAFVGVLGGLRALAPTRLRLAGASAGLLAGATGALVYALRCEELSAAFLGTWYVLGMLLPCAIGAITGPRLLRW